MRPLVPFDSRPVRGVLVDLDDTLYPRAEFLDTAWRAVAEHGAERGLNPDALLGALREETARSPTRDGILERALDRIGAATRHLGPLRAAFRAIDPRALTPYPGAVRALAELRRRVPVGLIADGEAAGQRRKLAALGLVDAFDLVVLVDLDGRADGALHATPFRRALAGLGLAPGDVVMIGDRPDRDAAGALAAGMRAVRVRTGEYATRPDHPGTWFGADSLACAVRGLLPHLPAPREPAPVEAAVEATVEAAPDGGPPTAPAPGLVPGNSRRSGALVQPGARVRRRSPADAYRQTAAAAARLRLSARP